MQTRHHSWPPFLLRAALAAGCFASVGANSLLAQTPTPAAPAGVDPATHAAHAAAGTHPTSGAAKVDPALAQQLSQLQAKIAQLEAALAKGHGAMPAMSGSTMPTPSTRAGGGQMGQMPPGGNMPAMSGGAGGSMNMMDMMSKMMGMMDKMMSAGGSGGAMPSGGGMGMMDMDMMKMGGMGGDRSGSGSMSGMGSGGGAMGMMGMSGGGGGMGGMPQSTLPGFPGASHLYHIGATGFFLDHPQHITLTTEQQAALNKAREQAALAKTSADRAIEQAEQELWMLTAADQPDAAKIEAKIREIEKLRGDERLAFIRAVGEASRLLTDEQRKILTGFAPPVGGAMPAGGMKGM